MHIYDVFQPDLKRGAEHLPFDPEKAYAYVEHPTQGWRVYLRTVVFIHDPVQPASRSRFLVVKRRGKRPSTPTWEPAKGQMEGKELRGAADTPILELLKEGARRETNEEMHIAPDELHNMHHTGLIFQAQERDFPQNWFFQYHLFTAEVTPQTIANAFAKFEWIKKHPRAFARWTRDRREKDAIAWFDPRTTPLNPRWCPEIVAGYLDQRTFQNVR